MSGVGPSASCENFGSTTHFAGMRRCTENGVKPSPEIPSWVSIQTSASSSVIKDLTASRPTPLPDISLTTSLVENPGSKIRLAASLAGIFWLAQVSTKPRSTAFLRISSKDRPLPSSEYTICRSLDSSRSKWTWRVASGDLLAFCRPEGNSIKFTKVLSQA